MIWRSLYKPLMLKKMKREPPKPQLQDFVEYIPTFTSNEELLTSLLNECEDLTKDLNAGSNLKTQWLCSKNEPYIYTDKEHIHNPKNINDFPNIVKLMNLVNTNDKVDGPLDSCLVHKYTDYSAHLRKHTDDEPLMDQSKSICTFSLGATRTIAFYSKGSKSKMVTSHRMEHDSLTIMKPGCQQNLLHKVRAESDRSNKNQVRYSISFRGICIDKPIVINNASGEHSDIPEDTHISSKPAPAPGVILIAGDSFAERMDTNKLGKNRVKVVNIAKGGQQIRHVKDSINNFFSDNPDIVVDKIIISIGTNDIRHCFNGITHLKGPVKHLFRNIKELSPKSKVYVQSLLPLPVIHKNVINNVVGFNNMLLNCCQFEQFYYMNVIPSFIDRWGLYRNNDLFNSSIRDVHPNKRGMGVLAKFYLFVIHNKRFNPLAI